jgi:hypothetical protein
VLIVQEGLEAQPLARLEDRPRDRCAVLARVADEDVVVVGAEHHLADEFRRIGVELQYLAAELEVNRVGRAAHHLHEREVAVDDVSEGGLGIGVHAPRPRPAILAMLGGGAGEANFARRAAWRGCGGMRRRSLTWALTHSPVTFWCTPRPWMRTSWR